MGKIKVDAAALRQLLNACIGPAHYIRELQVTRDNGSGLFPDNPIDILIKDYKAARETPDSAYRRHAEGEFRAAGWTDADGVFKDGMQKAICDHVLRLLDEFNDEGHSGTTAPYAINLFKQLASFEPLVPLTGEDWEWNEVEEGVFQNKRCSHVFKKASMFNGQAYDLDGKIFREPNGVCYTNRDSCVPVTFPYTPTSEYVDVAPDSDVV